MVVLRSAWLNFQTLVHVSRAVASSQLVTASCVAIPACCVIYFFPFDLEHQSCDISEQPGKRLLMLRMAVMNFRFWWFSSPIFRFSTAHKTRHFRFQNNFKTTSQKPWLFYKGNVVLVRKLQLPTSSLYLLQSRLYISCALTPKVICLAVDGFVLYCLNCHLNI